MLLYSSTVSYFILPYPLEHVHDHTHTAVSTLGRYPGPCFTRESNKCWICEDQSSTYHQVAHLIGATNSAAVSSVGFPIVNPFAHVHYQFTRYKQMGLIPAHIDNLSHPDNLLLLCSSCHTVFDFNPPGWLMVPTAPTLNRLIDHERRDYTARSAAGRRGIVQACTLPQITAAEVIYPRTHWSSRGGQYPAKTPWMV